MGEEAGVEEVQRGFLLWVQVKHADDRDRPGPERSVRDCAKVDSD